MNQQAFKQCKSILKKNYLHPIQKLGKGAFAIVFLVEKIQLQKNQNQLYSVKCINKKQIIKRPSLNKYIKQEIQILRTIQNPHVVKSYRIFEDQGWIFMVMEYCNKGNLNDKLLKTPGKVLSFNQTFYITTDIIKGLEYMHTRNLIHRDIKAENILLCSKKIKKTLETHKTLYPSNIVRKSIGSTFDYLTKICDLGFTTQYDSQVNTFCGTTCYMAPQIFQNYNYDNKVDIWALGVLIFYMLFGEFPFKCLNIELEIQKKCNEGFKITSVNSIKYNQSITQSDMILLEEFFAKIFVINPQHRLTLQQIKLYPWFTKDVNKLKQNAPSKRLSTMKMVSTPKMVIRSCQKTTIQSDSSSMDHPLLTNEQGNQEIQKYFFLKQIIEDVQKQKFLKESEEIAFKYYMFKLMESQSKKFFEISLKIQAKKEIILLKSMLEKYTNLMTQIVSKIQIPKFKVNNFNPKLIKFQDFKESYRLVVGHVFAMAHSKIKDDVVKRNQIKLKIFICHLINRVFNKQHNSGVFKYYEIYLKKMVTHKEKQDNQFNFELFKKWIQSEESQKLVQTIELLNSKFYKAKPNNQI